MDRETALKFILSLDFNGEKIGWISRQGRPEIPLEEASDEEIIGAANYLLTLQKGDALPN